MTDESISIERDPRDTPEAYFEAGTFDRDMFVTHVASRLACSDYVDVFTTAVDEGLTELSLELHELTKRVDVDTALATLKAKALKDRQQIADYLEASRNRNSTTTTNHYNDDRWWLAARTGIIIHLQIARDNERYLKDDAA